MNEQEQVRPNTAGCQVCRPYCDGGLVPLLLPVFVGGGSWPWAVAEAEASAGQVPAGWTLGEVLMPCECRVPGKAARVLKDWKSDGRQQLVAMLAWSQAERVRGRNPTLADALASGLEQQRVRTAKIAGMLRSAEAVARWEP